MLKIRYFLKFKILYQTVCCPWVLVTMFVSAEVTQYLKTTCLNLVLHFNSIENSILEYKCLCKSGNNRDFSFLFLASFREWISGPSVLAQSDIRKISQFLLAATNSRCTVCFRQQKHQCVGKLDKIAQSGSQGLN